MTLFTGRFSSLFNWNVSSWDYFPEFGSYLGQHRTRLLFWTKKCPGYFFNVIEIVILLSYPCFFLLFISGVNGSSLLICFFFFNFKIIYCYKNLIIISANGSSNVKDHCSQVSLTNIIIMKNWKYCENNQKVTQRQEVNKCWKNGTDRLSDARLPQIFSIYWEQWS